MSSKSHRTAPAPLIPRQELPQLRMDKLVAARAYLCEKLPFLRVAVYTLRMVPRPGLGTFATDRHWRMYYDPAVLERWGKPEVAAVIYHELDHLRRLHFERLARYGQKLANHAGDMAINDDIRDALSSFGLRLPERAIYPETFGLSAGELEEHYADALSRMGQPDHADPTASAVQSGSSQDNNAASGTSGRGDDDQSRDSSSGTSGRGGGDQSHGSSSSPVQDRSEDGGAESEGSDSARSASAAEHGGRPYHGHERPDPCAGRCGSAATGHAEPWELPVNDPEYPGVSESQAQTAWRAVAQAVAEQSSRSRGTVPGDWERWANRVLAPPRVPWRRELACVVSQAVSSAAVGMADYSYRRLNRRQWVMGGDIQLPGWMGPSPTVAIVVDTSGSMGNDEIHRAASEAMGIVCAVAGARAYLIACDAAVHAAHEVRVASQIRSAMVGGGGTDMRVGIDEAVRRYRPDVLVVITDGDTPWPEQRPDVRRAIVCIVHSDQSGPAWAKVIRIEKEL